METGRQSYGSIIEMPVIVFQGYIQWKNELESEKAKILNNGMKK